MRGWWSFTKGAVDNCLENEWLSMILSGPLDLLPWSCNTGPTEELIPAVTRCAASCIYVYVLHNVMNLPCCTITLNAEFLQSDCNLKSSLSPSALQYPHKRTHKQCIVTIQDNDIKLPLYWNSSAGVIPSQRINEGSVSPSQIDPFIYVALGIYLPSIKEWWTPPKVRAPAVNDTHDSALCQQANTPVCQIHIYPTAIIYCT